MTAFDPSIVLWFFFWLSLIFVAYHVISLLFHWIRFGKLYPLVVIATPVYLAGTLIFIGAMLAGIAGA